MVEDDGDQRERGDEQRLHQIQRRRVLYVVDDAPSFKYDFRHGREVVVKEDDVADVLRRFAAGSNADCAVRFLQSEDVVHAVARHGNGVSVRFDGFDQDRFLLGRDPSEYGIFVCDGGDFTVAQPFKRNVFFRIRNAYALRDFRNGARVVARNDADGNIVFFEPADGLRSVFTDIVRYRYDGDRLQPRRRRFPADRAGRVRHDQYAQPHGGVLVDDLVDLCRDRTEYEFRSADGDGPDLIERHGRQLALGGEGERNGRVQRRVMTEIIVQRDRSLVVVLQGIEAASDDLVYRIFGRVAQKHAVVHLHASVRDRARLIKAEHVYPREHFQGIQVLYERVVRHEANDAERQRDACQEQHARRDHADDDRNRALDSIVELRQIGESRVEIVPVDEEHADGDRNDQDADDHDDQLSRTHKFGFRLPVFFRLCGKGVEVGVFPDFIGPCAAVARRNEASGKKLVARLLFNGYGFARQERFIDFHRTLRDDAVRGDLVAERKDNNIVQYDVLGGDLGHLSVSHDFRRRYVQERQFIDFTLRLDLHRDTEGEVERKDENEQELREPCARIDERRCSKYAQQVEEGAEVADKDARVRFGILLVRIVEQELREPLVHLFGGQSLRRVSRVSFDL